MAQLCAGQGNQEWLRDLLVEVGQHAVQVGEDEGASPLSNLCGTVSGNRVLAQLCGGEHTKKWSYSMAVAALKDSVSSSHKRARQSFEGGSNNDSSGSSAMFASRPRYESESDDASVRFSTPDRRAGG